jgi:hypothetical protein
MVETRKTSRDGAKEHRLEVYATLFSGLSNDLSEPSRELPLCTRSDVRRGAIPRRESRKCPNLKPREKPRFGRNLTLPGLVLENSGCPEAPSGILDGRSSLPYRIRVTRWHRQRGSIGCRWCSLANLRRGRQKA